MTSKKASQRMHAKQRALERYGLTLNQQSYQAMAGMIRNQTQQHTDGILFVDRQSNRITRWFIKYQQRWFPVVYDSKRKTIVTILPEDSLGPLPT